LSAVFTPLSTAQALRLWHDVGVSQVKDDAVDLSVRQLTILLTIYLHPPPHTVRALAARLEVSKPVITRALDAMGKRGLVTRRRDDKDMRNVLIQRTVGGALFLEKLGDLVSAASKEI
jgi:DNA-binding MarR family transcriptional regulator